MEHRWGDRQHVILGVRLYGPGQVCATGRLTDISLSGAYVRTTSRLAVMSQVTLEVDERDSPYRNADPPARSHAEIVAGPWVKWSGIEP